MKKKAISYHMRIVQLLSDGEWHSFKDICKAIAKHVDAGIAEAEFKKRHPGFRKFKQAERIAQGRRRLVFLSLNSMHHHRGMVEVGAKGRADDRMYRLTKAALKARTNGQAAPTSKKTNGKKMKARKEAPSTKANRKKATAKATALARKPTKPAVAEPKPATTDAPSLFSTSEA